LEHIINDILEKNEKAISDYRSGNEKVINFLIGQAMRALGGRGDQNLIREMIMKKIREKN
jgi:aspartyl-tRNA(Asn)/glutamyl-tRNA(Gln) amidotransferase subunit B